MGTAYNRLLHWLAAACARCLAPEGEGATCPLAACVTVASAYGTADNSNNQCMLGFREARRSSAFPALACLRAAGCQPTTAHLDKRERRCLLFLVKPLHVFAKQQRAGGQCGAPGQAPRRPCAWCSAARASRRPAPGCAAGSPGRRRARRRVAGSGALRLRTSRNCRHNACRLPALRALVL